MVTVHKRHRHFRFTVSLFAAVLGQRLHRLGHQSADLVIGKPKLVRVEVQDPDLLEHL